MTILLNWYRDGGVWMHPILVLGLGGVVLEITAGLRGNARELRATLLGMALCTLLFGLTAVAHGAQYVWHAVGARPDLSWDLLTFGGAILFNPVIFACAWVCGQIVVGAWVFYDWHRSR
jgi:hypothetical protein